jgi:hypothetical protein
MWGLEVPREHILSLIEISKELHLYNLFRNAGCVRLLFSDVSARTV